MKKIGIFIFSTFFLVVASGVEARNDVLTLPLENLLNSPQAEQALLDVPLYFAHQTTPRVSHRREITVNRKTNAFNKTDIEACQWVMLSALKALQESAKKNGYDAVASIKSNYQHNEFASNSEFQCGAGTFIAGAALKADLIRFKN